MTTLLDRALEVARKLPAGTQHDIARIGPGLAGEDEAQVALAASEHDAIAVSRSAAARGDFASDAEISSIWAKHGL